MNCQRNLQLLFDPRQIEVTTQSLDQCSYSVKFKKKKKNKLNTNLINTNELNTNKIHYIK